MSDIKDCFVSRFGNKGFIVEFDYSQLEVIGLAELSQDEQLMEDVRNGVDMHCMAASFLYQTPYETIKHAYDRGDKQWTKRRKISKGPGFLLQYGGGAKLMAKNTGLTVEQCQQFIDNYYRRYPKVKEWQDANIEAVEASRELVLKDPSDIAPTGKGTLISPTGRRYVFWERPSPEWKRRQGGNATSFPPTNIKNYPVQGFSTGDIVPEVLGRVKTALLDRSEIMPLDKVLMINTVHDSILFDIHEDYLEQAIHAVKEAMADVPRWVKVRWGMELSLPFHVGVDVGTTWGDKQPLETLL
jgi:DNA polymerase I-like protein with 3'-5' exonuclease and polymerase domains